MCFACLKLCVFLVSLIYEDLINFIRELMYKIGFVGVFVACCLFIYLDIQSECFEAPTDLFIRLRL